MKITSSFLDTVPGFHYDRQRLAQISARSENPGPLVWLTAGVHGDEVGGIVVIQEVFKRLRRQPLLRGAVCALPLLNPLGFETASRQVPISQEDLNRAFPGSTAGTLAQRMAHQVFQTIMATKPTLVLDLHNDWTQSVPHTLIDPAPPELPTTAYQQLQEIAARSGFVTILDQTVYTGTLSYTMLQHGVAALSMELGEAYVVNERNIAIGVDSIWSMLSSLELIAPHQPFHFEYEHRPTKSLLTYSDKPLASATGIARFAVRPGQQVSRDQVIARIYSPLGRLRETLRATQDALVLGHTDYSVVFPGIAVMSFGV
ncbi:MAG TPA: succinylglutamate desuccinylase/aspartoacylase family protein [Candidatus Andersenbacteria bacterium]|nr:succinylglutamate desuccinylase/aspartoacylase family protein [Candidatus Andersenbacteria bacterium]